VEAPASKKKTARSVAAAARRTRATQSAATAAVGQSSEDVTSAEGSVGGGPDPTLQLLDSSYSEIRGRLLELLQNGSAASSERIACLEAELATSKARTAELEAELSVAHERIDELEAGIRSSSVAAAEATNAEETGEVVAAPPVPEVKVTEASAELSSPAPRSETALDLGEDSAMTDVFDNDPLATPSRPGGDFEDRFGRVFQGPTPEPSLANLTQMLAPSPATHEAGVVGQGTDGAEELEEEVSFGQTAI
jgi:hypothetical protein